MANKALSWSILCICILCAIQPQKPYTIEETLVKLRILEIIELVCFRERKKMEAVPLSDDVTCARIVDISSHSAGIHRRVSSNLPLTFNRIKIWMVLGAASFDFNHYLYIGTIKRVATLWNIIIIIFFLHSLVLSLLRELLRWLATNGFAASVKRALLSVSAHGIH